MKRISVIISTVIFPLLVNAQQDFVDQLIGKY